MSSKIRLPNPKRRRIHGSVRWVVRLGKSITGGDEKKKVFRTKSEAKAFLAEIGKHHQRYGSSAQEISMDEMAEAARCRERLAKVAADLLIATDFYLKHWRPVADHPTIKVVCERFLTNCERRKLREKTQSEYRSKFRRIVKTFGDRMIDQLNSSDLERWIQGLGVSVRTQRGYLQALSTLMNFGLRRECCTSNPAAKIEPPIADEKPPGILSVDQSRSLLWTCESRFPGLLPGLCVGLFAGIRRSEIQALEWRNVDRDQGVIRITAASSKTRRHRLVKINETLSEWLNRSTNETGRVVPYAHIDTFGQRLRKLAIEYSIQPWPHNALRHSFGSYFLALSGNEHLTAQQMGTRRMLWSGIIGRW